MHILILPTWFETPAHPTAGKAVKDLALALSQHGHSVQILYSSEEHTVSTREWKSITIDHFFFKGRGKLFPGFNKRYLQEIEIQLDYYFSKKGVPDLIHAHSYPVLAACHFIYEKWNIPFIYTEHSSKIGLGHTLFLENLFIRKYARRAMSITAVGSQLTATLSRLLGKKVRTIANTIDFEVFKPGKQAPQNHVLMVSLLTKNKQIDLAIRAFSIFREKNQTAQLIIVGNGPEKERLIKLVQELNLTEQVQMLGEQDHTKWLSWMQTCLCFLSTSKFETFGVAVVEALACGVPVVALENGGINDLPPLSGLNVLKRKASAQEIAESMNDCQKYTEEGYIHSNHHILKQKYNYQNIAAQYSELYHMRP